MSTILGTNADDVLTGTTTADFIVAYGGDDIITAGGGDDILRGGAGADELHGGTGIDRADYRDSTVGIYVEYRSGSGFVADGTTYAYGSVTYGAGAASDGDYLVSVERVIGSAFDDFFVGNDADNHYYVIDGYNIMQGGGGSDWINFALTSGANGYVGEIGTGQIVQSAFLPSEVTWDGADNFASSMWNTSTSKISVSSVENAIGSDYADWLQGGRDDNEIRGEGGNDFLTGGSGDDILRGGDGNDDLRGGSHDDALYGDAGSDAIYGGYQDDDLWGGSGNDHLDGESGRDVLRGGSGDDTLTGGSDSDDDYLYGNAGSDVFIFFDAIGADRIMDFEDGSDLIDLSQVSTIHSFADVAGLIRQSGNHVVIDVGTDDIVIRNTVVADIDASDFVF